MKAPAATSIRQGDHGPQARSNCKKISPQHLQTGKHEYFLKAEIHGRSKPWEFFTDDYDGPSSRQYQERPLRTGCRWADRSARGRQCRPREPRGEAEIRPGFDSYSLLLVR